MNTFNRIYTIKKIAAAAIAVTISLAAFGVSADSRGGMSGVGVISGAAAEKDENAEYDRQLAELEQKKAELDQKIAAAGSDIDGQQEKLDAVNEKAKIIKKKIAKVSKKAEQLENEMADIDDAMRETMYNLAQSEEAISVGLEEFKERLRVLYVAGNDSYSQVLVNADSFYDVLMRIELVKRVAKHDNDTIDSLLEQKAQIEQYQAELEVQSNELKAKSAEYGEKQRDLAEQQAELLKLSQEYGDSIEALKGDLGGYLSEAQLVNDEYNRVWAEAQTTTTTTTTVATTPSPADTDDSSSGGSTTTRRNTDPGSSSDDGSTTTRRTTTTTAAPDEPEPSTTTTTSESNGATTTRAPETTTSQTTTTQAPEPAPAPSDSDREAKINIVVNYAKGMVGGRYVWAGEQYGATDCSGLVMLSYRQIGINLPHLAQSQANFGTTVSRSSLMPGDLVFFGSWANIYHVAMYIGDGKIVHAESTATGIVISYLDSVARYNNVVCCKRLI